MSRSTVEERFWSKVDKGPDCWLWTASTFKTGRGQFRVGVRNQQAHRVAWELTFRAPPLGLLRSRCGNLLCVRPDHQVVAEHMGMSSNLARTPVTRFAAMVSTGPGCWSWTGSTDHLGYGQFGVMAPGEGRKMVRAHRFAWEQASGAIPDGADVLHRCGSRTCVRPDHLFLRTGGRAPTHPTRRELDILRACVRAGLGYGSLKRAAAELGSNYGVAAHHMSKVRARLGVKSNLEAVAWLDEHEPGWRDDSARQ